MKKNKKFLKVAIVCMCFVVGGMAVPITSQAKEVEMKIEPRMTYISTYSTDLNISNTGLATITGEVKGKNGVTSAYVKVTLQKYESGNWIDEKDWEDSQNGKNAFVSETYQIEKGTYRVFMTCSANSETKTATSAERTYK